MRSAVRVLFEPVEPGTHISVMAPWFQAYFEWLEREVETTSARTKFHRHSMREKPRMKDEWSDGPWITNPVSITDLGPEAQKALNEHPPQPQDDSPGFRAHQRWVLKYVEEHVPEQLTDDETIWFRGIPLPGKRGEITVLGLVADD